MARRRILDALQFCVGGSPVLIALLFYNWTLTGSPFHLAYSFVDDPAFQHMRTAFGFGLPSITAMMSLLVGPSRGSSRYLASSDGYRRRRFFHLHFGLQNVLGRLGFRSPTSDSCTISALLRRPLMVRAIVLAEMADLYALIHRSV
jgi:hypothetical protein